MSDKEEAFNSLSRDHTVEATVSERGAMQAFNSLSRDHKTVQG